MMPFKRFFKVEFLVAATALALFALAEARSAEPAKTPAPPTSVRSKSIKFEDDVVEGMNKNPLDSAENLGRRDGGQHGHLYKKPLDFKDAIKQTVHEMGKTP